MAIEIQCTGCGAGFQVPDRLSGKLIRCKTCHTQFRVGGELPAIDQDDEPLPPRRRAKTSSVVVPILLVGGMLLGCSIAAIGFVIWIIREPAAAPPGPVVAFRALPQPVIRTIVPRHALVRPNVVLPKYTIMPPRQAAGAGPTAEPTPGAAAVNLSNLRQVDGLTPQDPTWLVDYAWQNAAPKSGDRIRLVVKVPAGISENSIQLDGEKSDGSISFRFFPGTVPAHGFELWVEQKTLNGGQWQYKRVSNVVAEK
jgi:hypothetical protein